MFLLFLALWIIFNGRVTVEILLFGVVISAAMYWFICKFMGYTPQSELIIFKRKVFILSNIYFTL